MDGRSNRRGRTAVRAAAVAIAAAVVSPVPAHADFWCWLLGDCGDGGRGSTSARETSPEQGAPEIDPGTLAGAAAVAAGGAALLGDRVRRRRR
ncbi:MAG: hypothetical protein IT294_11495 [Deltaproteobacteria bacterium]|nr:hypothetical protein [Deltaproteobacteria bacterium]